MFTVSSNVRGEKTKNITRNFARQICFLIRKVEKSIFYLRANKVEFFSYYLYFCLNSDRSEKFQNTPRCFSSSYIGRSCKQFYGMTVWRSKSLTNNTICRQSLSRFTSLPQKLENSLRGKITRASLFISVFPPDKFDRASFPGSCSYRCIPSSRI